MKTEVIKTENGIKLIQGETEIVFDKVEGVEVCRLMIAAMGDQEITQYEDEDFTVSDAIKSVPLATFESDLSSIVSIRTQCPITVTCEEVSLGLNNVKMNLDLCWKWTEDDE